MIGIRKYPDKFISLYKVSVSSVTEIQPCIHLRKSTASRAVAAFLGFWCDPWPWNLCIWKPPTYLALGRCGTALGISGGTKFNLIHNRLVWWNTCSQESTISWDRVPKKTRWYKFMAPSPILTRRQRLNRLNFDPQPPQPSTSRHWEVSGCHGRSTSPASSCWIVERLQDPPPVNRELADV